MNVYKKSGIFHILHKECQGENRELCKHNVSSWNGKKNLLQWNPATFSPFAGLNEFIIFVVAAVLKYELFSGFPAVQFNSTTWHFCVCVVFFLCAAGLSLECGLNKVFPCSHAAHRTHQLPGETTRLLGPPRLTANLVPCLLPNVPFAVVLMNLAVKLILSPPPLFTETPSNQPAGPAIVFSSLWG